MDERSSPSHVATVDAHFQSDHSDLKQTIIIEQPPHQQQQQQQQPQQLALPPMRPSRAFRHFQNPPQPHMCIRHHTVDGHELFINVMSWTRIVMPQNADEPIPLYGGMRVPPSSIRSPPLVYAVMANPDILKHVGRNCPDPEKRLAVVELMCDFVEAMNPGLKLAKDAEVLKDRDLSGELKDIWGAVQAKREREKEAPVTYAAPSYENHMAAQNQVTYMEFGPEPSNQKQQPLSPTATVSKIPIQTASLPSSAIINNSEQFNGNSSNSAVAVVGLQQQQQQQQNSNTSAQTQAKHLESASIKQTANNDSNDDDDDDDDDDDNNNDNSDGDDSTDGKSVKKTDSMQSNTNPSINNKMESNIPISHSNAKTVTSKILKIASTTTTTTTTPTTTIPTITATVTTTPTTITTSKSVTTTPSSSSSSMTKSSSSSSSSSTIVPTQQPTTTNPPTSTKKEKLGGFLPNGCHNIFPFIKSKSSQNKKDTQKEKKSSGKGSIMDFTKTGHWRSSSNYQQQSDNKQQSTISGGKDINLITGKPDVVMTKATAQQQKIEQKPIKSDSCAEKLQKLKL